MKIIYGNLAELELIPEDGRDRLWMNEFLLNMTDEGRKKLDGFLLIDFDDSSYMDFDQNKLAKGISPTEAVTDNYGYDKKKGGEFKTGEKFVWGVIEKFEFHPFSF